MKPRAAPEAAPLAPAPAVDEAEFDRLREIARRIRVEVIRSVDHAKGGHIGGPLSAAELLAALFFRVLRIRPEEPDWPDRDRFVFSKGHSSIGLYAAMALRGYFPVEELATFDALGSRLQGHPDMIRLPSLDMSTGSLGMGLSAGVGMALGARLLGRELRTYVMLGDGECQEGQVWEAAFVASRYGLDRLVAVVDHNRLQQYGWQGTGPEHRLPPHRPAPGLMISMLVPRLPIILSTSFWAPLEMATMTMTEAIPMMIPSMVRKLRRAFNRSATKATLILFQKVMRQPNPDFYIYGHRRDVHHGTTGAAGIFRRLPVHG